MWFGDQQEEDISATKLSTPATTAYTNFLSESAKEVSLQPFNALDLPANDWQ